MKDLYKPQEIAAVPTIEVARWSARIDRINYALGQNYSVHKGGEMADDGQLVGMLGEKALKGEDWQSDKLYEEAVLYGMKPEVEYWTVCPLVAEPEPNPALRVGPRHAEYAATSTVGRIATEDGYSRVGLLVPDDKSGGTGVTVPIEAVAALAFKRADIRHEVDRKLFDRRTEITDATETILDTVLPRGLTDHHNYQESVYRALSYPNETLQDKLGGGTHTELWWKELIRDLHLIDQASGSL